MQEGRNWISLILRLCWSVQLCALRLHWHSGPSQFHPISAGCGRPWRQYLTTLGGRGVLGKGGKGTRESAFSGIP